MSQTLTLALEICSPVAADEFHVTGIDPSNLSLKSAINCFLKGPGLKCYAFSSCGPPFVCFLGLFKAILRGCLRTTKLVVYFDLD